MPKIFTEKTKFDPANKAESILDHVLDETSEITQYRKQQEVSVEDALDSDKIIEHTSKRIQSRVLFITHDATISEAGSPLQKHIRTMQEVFDEIHVLILHVGKRNTDTTRIAPNIWLYPVSAKYFLTQPFAVFSIAKRQLQFAEGFRPDIVVSLDPFESGISGYLLARKYKRAFQVQIRDDFLTDEFEKQDEANKWRLRFARYVLKRTNSIRVSTSLLQEKLKAKYPKKEHIRLLPRFFNISDITDRTKNTPTVDKYPQFSFTILFVGSLTHRSTLFRAIDATRRLLATPSIGFVIIGDGPSKTEFQQRTKILGIDAQTIFLPKVDDLVAHMRSADVLICTDTISESDEVVITSAAAGLPMVIARTPLREDLFIDNKDAFLCDPNDTIDFSTKLTKFLNTNALRSQFAQNAQHVVETRIEESLASYQQALRDSIEEAFVFMDDNTERLKEVQHTGQDTLPPTETSGDSASPQSQTQTIAGIIMKLPENN